METPHKFIISIIMFWIVLGSVLQMAGLEDENTSKLNPDTGRDYIGFTGKIAFVWDLMTFNIDGMPDGFRFKLNTFFVSSLAISIYVLLRSGS